VGFSCKFVVGTLHNGIYRTGLLTESTVDTFSHIDIITGGSTSTIFASFCLDGNSLCRANSLAKFARDATFISGWVSSQGVFATKARTQITPFKRIIDGNLRFGRDLKGKSKTTENFCQEKNLRSSVEDCFPRSLFFNLNSGKYFKILYEKIKSAKQRKQKEKNQRIYRGLTIDYYEVQSMYEEEKNRNEYE
jgi:hypothetical protein